MVRSQRKAPINRLPGVNTCTICRAIVYVPESESESEMKV